MLYQDKLFVPLTSQDEDGEIPTEPETTEPETEEETTEPELE